MLGIATLALLLSFVRSRYVSDVYPTSIPKYNLRIDFYTNKPVQSGLLHTLPSKNTLADFYRHLQCPRTQPDFNYNNGLVSMLRMITPTSEMIKLFCARVESKCITREDCHAAKARYEAGNYTNQEGFNKLSKWAWGHLYRVIDGKMKLDWPWGIDRFAKYEKYAESGLSDSQVGLAKMALDKISDMRDSVFFQGGDTPSIPFDMPMPIFSAAVSDPLSDMVWPWYEMWQDANKAYKKIRAAKLVFSDASFEQMEVGYRNWTDRVPKAAYFASNKGMIRQFMFEVARLHPVLMDSKFPDTNIRNWNPHYGDRIGLNQKEALVHNATAVAAAQSLSAGYALALANFSSLGRFTSYTAGAYKYVVVPLARSLSTAGRLQHLLSHSGAVVMIQRSRTKFQPSFTSVLGSGRGCTVCL